METELSWVTLHSRSRSDYNSWKYKHTFKINYCGRKLQEIGDFFSGNKAIGSANIQL